MNQSAERKGVGRGAWFRLRLIFLPQVPGPALWALVLVIALAFCSLFETAHALTFDYDPLRPTELRTCDDHRYRGREEAAQECYTELFVSSRNDALRAQAVWAMGDLAAANVLFRQYLRVSPNAVIPRNAWGRLYLETHQDDEALKLFREALKIDAANVQAKLGMAQIFVNRFEGQARALVAEVLKKNDDLIEAHLLLARMDLEEGKLEEAERSVDRAFTLTEKQKQPPLEVYALRATLDLMRGGDGASGSDARWPTMLITAAFMKPWRIRKSYAGAMCKRQLCCAKRLKSSPVYRRRMPNSARIYYDWAPPRKGRSTWRRLMKATLTI
jgi:tetratricopeptide (TPR) repeat protein